MPEIVYVGDVVPEIKALRKRFASGLYNLQPDALHITINLSALAAEIIQLKIGDKISLYMLPRLSKLKLHKTELGTNTFRNDLRPDNQGLIMRGHSNFRYPLAHVCHWLPYFPHRVVQEKFFSTEVTWGKDWIEFPSSLFKGFGV